MKELLRTALLAAGLTALAFLGAGVLLFSTPLPVVAQVPVEAALEGRVTLDGAGLEGETVVLHSVAPDRAGPVDSTVAAGDGRFRLELPAVPGSPGGPVYFGSVRYLGVLYFGIAVHSPTLLDSLYRIEVFDTTYAVPEGAGLPVGARNVLLEEVEEGWRAVDLFQIRNEGDRTVVARDGAVVWSYPLPEGANDFEMGQSDLAPEAVLFEGGRVRVSAPIPPGERTYLIRYTLPELTTTIPLPGRIDRFELLIREPIPDVSVSGAAAVESVEIERGSRYRRFVAAGVSNTTVEIREGGPPGSEQIPWIAVVLGLVLAGAGIVAVRREPAPEPWGAGEGGGGRDEIALQIAELDQAFHLLEDPSSEARDRYHTVRRRLKGRLRGGD